MLFPPFLKPGDTIAITCPAGAIDPGEQEDALSYLHAMGFQTTVGNTVGNCYHRFSATDDERRKELQNFMDDDKIAAILCGRGGYGTMRIIEQLDCTFFTKNPKWLIGFSDITCLHSFIQNKTGVVTLHGHMLKGFQPKYSDMLSSSYLMQILQGTLPTYGWQSRYEQEVEVRGRLVGGNLALLSDLVGTQAEVDTEGAILFVEDVSEYYYNIDRMMMQLKLAGKLSGIRALLVGAFTDLQDNEVPFGESIRDIMLRVTQDYGVPVVMDLPAGHQKENWPLMLGAEYELKQRSIECSLKPIANVEV